MTWITARGSIGPNRYSQDEKLAEQIQDGMWLVPARGLIPADCIDGRPQAPNELPNEYPASAGGVIGLWAATNMSLPLIHDPVSFDDFLADLELDGLTIGAHRAEGSSGDASGCGAADHLPELLLLLVQQVDVVRDIIRSWGFEAGLLDDSMLLRARHLAAWTPSGAKLLDQVEASPSSQVSTLVGQHEESFAVINQRPRTTVNVAGLTAAYKPSPQVFCVDAWAFPTAGLVLAPLAPERMAVALAAVNAAALLLLASPQLPELIVPDPTADADEDAI